MEWANLALARALHLRDLGMDEIGHVLERDRPSELPLVVYIGMGAPVVVFRWAACEDFLQVVVAAAVYVRLVDGVFVGLVNGADLDVCMFVFREVNLAAFSFFFRIDRIVLLG
jgi:hypothetical protein